MLKVHALDSIFPHSNNFAHCVEVPPGTRLCFASGQIGIEKDGSIPATTREQAELCFRRIEALLAASRMTLGDVVRINAYITDTREGDAYRAARDKFMGDHKPANTVLFITGLARPELKIEIEVVAAKAD